MYVAGVILWFGIWSRHTFNSCVIVTSAMQFSTAQVVNIISSEWWHLPQYGTTLNISWDTDSVLTQRGCANMLNYKHRSLHNVFLGHFLLKAGSLLNLFVLRAEEELVHKVWKPPSENWIYCSFLLCYCDLGRLSKQKQNWKPVHILQDISTHIIVVWIDPQNSFHWNPLCFWQLFLQLAFFKNGISSKLNLAGRLVQTCMRLIISSEYTHRYCRRCHIKNVLPSFL